MGSVLALARCPLSNFLGTHEEAAREFALQRDAVLLKVARTHPWIKNRSHLRSVLSYAHHQFRGADGNRKVVAQAIV